MDDSEVHAIKYMQCTIADTCAAHLSLCQGQRRERGERRGQCSSATQISWEIAEIISLGGFQEILAVMPESGEIADPLGDSTKKAQAKMLKKATGGRGIAFAAGKGKQADHDDADSDESESDGEFAPGSLPSLAMPRAATRARQAPRGPHVYMN